MSAGKERFDSRRWSARGAKSGVKNAELDGAFDLTTAAPALRPRRRIWTTAAAPAASAFPEPFPWTPWTPPGAGTPPPQEAVSSGVIRHLRPDDYVVSTYRDHVHALSKGVSAREVMAELFGKKTGCCRCVVLETTPRHAAPFFLLEVSREKDGGNGSQPNDAAYRTDMGGVPNCGGEMP